MHPALTGHKLGLYMACTFGFVLLVAGAASNLHPASADPVIKILPAQPSYAGDAIDLIRIRAILETGNPIDMIRITLDDGTADERVYEFDINGKVIRADAGLADAACEATFRSDGYSIGSSVVDCVVGIDRSTLAAGSHQIKSELVTDTAMFTDESELVLHASSG